MDELLTPVRTTYLRREKDGKSLLVQIQGPTTSKIKNSESIKIESADDVLFLLKSQPDYDSLSAALRFLTSNHGPSTFDIHVPSPSSAAIIQVIVTEICTNYWSLLQEGQLSDEFSDPAAGKVSDADRLIQSLQCVTGVNAVVGHIKALLLTSSTSKQGLKESDANLHLGIFLDLLAALLKGNGAIRHLWHSSTSKLADDASKKAQAHSLLALVTSGRIPSLAAEASDVVGRDKTPSNARWLFDGVEFSRWIASNIVGWAKARPEADIELQYCFEFFQRSFSLGYAEVIVTYAVDEMLLSRGVRRDLFFKVCLRQSQVSKKAIGMVLGYLSRKFLNPLSLDDAAPNDKVSATASVIADLVQSDQYCTAHLVNWCSGTSGAGLGESVGIRRAVVAVLARHKETITALLDKSLDQFGDQLYIKHTAIMQQRVHTEILLLAAGHIARLFPIKLAILLRSGTYLRTISNRIASTHSKARFLGMCVGEALSSLQDSNTKKLNFHMEDTDTEEAKWLKGLTNVADTVGPVDSVLLTISQSSLPTTNGLPKSRPPKQAQMPSRSMRNKSTSQPGPRPIVEEIDSSDVEEVDDLHPVLEKGSDSEESDDDATLVRRNKPKPPVYIRDLITFLRDSESLDKQELGVKTAPVLIRRKANYGTEVSSHAEELARLLVGLQDKYDIEDFENQRLQSMIALVVAQPKSMAPWFARTFFEGDYSLSQRTSVLVTLGLSARELAGIETSEYQSASNFASKRLPSKMERLYLESAHRTQSISSSASTNLKGLPPNALDTITQSLTSSFLGPLAAGAADAISGPDALKMQTFTARYKSKSRVKPRVRAIPNTTAALLSTYFFSPLTAHFQFALRSSKPVVLNPAVLALYLQTLAIIVNAAGPSTLSLPQLTSELWDLLLRVRVHVLGDTSATKGWLVAMSVLLEVNGDNLRRLCDEQGREVIESRDWVSGVFERTRGEDGGEENDVKMLAAGVLIKLGEVVEKYQALLMGDLIGYNWK